MSPEIALTILTLAVIIFMFIGLVIIILMFTSKSKGSGIEKFVPTRNLWEGKTIDTLTSYYITTGTSYPFEEEE